MNNLGRNLLDQTVVFRIDIFQPQFRALPQRVWKVIGGFGANPVTNGRNLHCRSVLTGDEAQFDGMAVERLATDADLAAVAAAKRP